MLKGLMPSLSNPATTPIEELSLAGNGFTDEDCGELLAKIVAMHCERRDEIIWKYSLRGEYPPLEAIRGLKKFDLSFNKLGYKTALAMGAVLKQDRYLLCLNLRSCQFNNE